ncbi:zinc finger protein 180-like isoform X4 [Periplaneta americana]
MDVIKMEVEVDPLTVHTIDNGHVEEKKPLREEGNFFDFHMADIKMECEDHGCDLTSEIKVEETTETAVPTNFVTLKCEAEEETSVQCNDPTRDLKWEVKVEESPEPVALSVVKCEPQEEIFDVVKVKEEAKLEIMREESEVFTDSTPNTDEHEVPLVEPTRTDEIPDCETQTYDELLTAENSLQSQFPGRIEKYLFRCNICGKSLRSLHSLQMHTRGHVGDTRFKCDTCGKCFTQSGHLRSHAHTHTGEKPFKCDFCEKCFSQSGHLKRHERTHTCDKLFKCDVCGKSFLQPAYLKSHAVTHTGEKPFKCDICWKYFSQSGTLGRHRRLHSCESVI